MKAVRKIYSGARDARTGEQIFPGWVPGGETGWGAYFVGKPEPARLDFWRYWIFGDPAWDPRSFDFDRDVKFAESPLPQVNANKREAKRLGLVDTTGGMHSFVRVVKAEDLALRRPGRFWPNLILTLLLIGGMIGLKLDPVVVFMLGVVIALQINYPDLAMQRERADAHARPALMMASILFAAGAFAGIMKESGMLAAMAKLVAAGTPAGSGPHLPLILGLAAMPLSVLFDPNSFYFGVLPCSRKRAGALESPQSRSPRHRCSTCTRPAFRWVRSLRPRSWLRARGNRSA